MGESMALTMPPNKAMATKFQKLITFKEINTPIKKGTGRKSDLSEYQKFLSVEMIGNESAEGA